MADTSQHDNVVKLKTVLDLQKYLKEVDINDVLRCAEEGDVLITFLKKVCDDFVNQWRPNSTSMVNPTSQRDGSEEIVGLVKRSDECMGVAAQSLCSILHCCVTRLVEDGLRPANQPCTTVSLLLWCLRCLRNACSQSSCIPNIIWEAGIMQQAKCLISLISSSSSSDDQHDHVTACLRCTVQLLANLVTGQPNLQTPAWKETFPHTLLSIFQYSDLKSSQYICLFIKVCIQAQGIAHQLWSCHDGHRLVEAVLMLCQVEGQQDFSLQLVQSLMAEPAFLPSIFHHVGPSSKILLLEMLAGFLSSDDDSDDDSPPTQEVAAGSSKESPSWCGTIGFIAETFEEEAGSVFALVGDETWSDIEKQQKPILVMRLLNVLCEAGTGPEANSKLNSRTTLLECILDLLARASTAGKNSQNHFSINQRLEETDAKSNPVFGFRADLVRLIGNMCHDNKANQDRVRELHGIPIILEQCILDGNNPFISQWAIFAIRNLCAGNVKNQAVIAQMSNKGVTNNDVLQQYGFQAEWRGDSMYYKSSRHK